MKRSALSPLAARLAAVAAAEQIVAARRGWSGGATMHAVLDRLQQERDACTSFIDRTLNEVNGRDLSDTELQSLENQRTRIRELDAQIAPLRDFESLREADTSATARFTPSGQTEPGTTEHRGVSGGGGGEQRGGGTGLGAQTNAREYEYATAGELLADSWRASQRDDQNAANRLRTVGLEVRSEKLVRVDRRGMDERASAPHNTTAEVPGLMPRPIVGPIMNNIDARRPFINSVGARDLGSIPGSTFDRPVVTGHVTVGKQTAEKAEVPSGQLKIGSVPFTKESFGGWANVSQQTIDWTSPAMWDALLNDFVEIYGLQTEAVAAAAFNAAVTQKVELETAAGGRPTLEQLLTALYGAAIKSYQGSGRLPDHIWCSLDWWQTLGVLVDHLKATTNGDGAGNNSSINEFAGNLIRTPRTIVPSFPTGTLIVGVADRTEVYEDRWGFLSVVQPRVFGVELAYGGAMATGTVKPAAFARVVNES